MGTFRLEQPSRACSEPMQKPCEDKPRAELLLVTPLPIAKARLASCAAPRSWRRIARAMAGNQSRRHGEECLLAQTCSSRQRARWQRWRPDDGGARALLRERLRPHAGRARPWRHPMAMPIPIAVLGAPARMIPRMRRDPAHLPLPTAQTHAMDAPLDLSRALGDASPQGGGQGPTADRLIGHTFALPQHNHTMAALPIPGR